MSLEAQEARLRTWATQHEPLFGEVLIYRDEGISGMRADRPALSECLAACRAGDYLVVYSLSRLARSTTDLLLLVRDLEERRIELVSLTDQVDTSTASGKLFFRLTAVLNEFERDLVSERTSAALQYKKGRGLRVGSIPIGSRLKVGDEKALEPSQEEQAAIAVARDLRGQGLSFPKIAARLSALGYKPRGTCWYAMTVSRMVAQVY